MLILVRHGRTALNASRRLLGRLDVPLDELGLVQAQQLGQVDLLRKASRVVASPLLRTRQTAEALGPPVTVDDRWVEIDYGIFDGLPLGDVPDLFSRWEDRLDWAPEGGESLASVGARVRAACEDLWEEAAERDIVVVTHVSPLKAAVTWALGATDSSTWHLFVDVASVSRIGVGGRGPTLRTFNETHYRASELRTVPAAQ